MKNLTKNQPTASRWVCQLPSSTALLDDKLQLIDASELWFKTFNFSRSKVIGHSFFELFPECNESWQDSFDYAFEGLTDIKIIENSTAVAHPSGKEFLWKVNPWKDGYGKSIGIILNVQDVTEKAALEMELRKTRKLLKEKGAIAKIGSWEYNITSQRLYWSKELKDILGMKSAKTPSFNDIVHMLKPGEHRNTMRRLLQDAIENGKPWNQNLQAVTAEGHVIWINSIGRPKFKNGKCVRVIGTIQNIEGTYGNDPNSVAVEGNDMMGALLDKVSVGIAVIDFSTGKIQSVNEALASSLNEATDTFLDKDFDEFLTFTPKEKKAWYRQIIENGYFEGITKEVPSNSLTDRVIFKLSGKLVVNGLQKSLLVCCENIADDQVKLRQTTKELNAANESLERLTHFMHMVSHNLKAHTTNFSLLLNFLNNEKNDSERETLLHMLFQSTENLSSSIKGLRDLVTIRHKIKDKKESVPINGLVYKIVQNNNGLVKQHNVKIHNEITDGFKVDGIPVFVESIISNLFINAIKFRNENKVTIVYVSSEEREAHSVMHIEDNGVGMNLKEESNKLFELYKTLQNMDPSSGIGLYLAKYQMELMKGKITVESKLNKGTRFSLHFPKQN